MRNGNVISVAYMTVMTMVQIMQRTKTIEMSAHSSQSGESAGMHILQSVRCILVGGYDVVFSLLVWLPSPRSHLTKLNPTTESGRCSATDLAIASTASRDKDLTRVSYAPFHMR